MPVYVYGCDRDKQHPRREVVHGYHDEPVILCKCGAVMHRVPQLFSWGWEAGLVMFDSMDEEYRAIRGGGRQGHQELLAERGELGKSAWETVES